jgi:hypothetical protein
MAIAREPVNDAPVTRRERRTERASWVPTIGPGMVLGVVGTVGVVVAMFMSWRTGNVHPSDIPFAFLFDSSTTAQNPSLLIALIPLAVILAVGSLMPRASGARVIAGFLLLVVVVVFAVQVNSAVDQTPGVSVWDQLDTGFYVAGIAGIVALVSGFMPSGWMRRRWTESDAAVGDQRAAAYDERRTV